MMPRLHFNPETLRDMRDLVESKPLLGQIALLYYLSVRGERNNQLANFVLKQLDDFDYTKFYEERLLEEHATTRKEWGEFQMALDRARDTVWKRAGKKNEYPSDEEFEEATEEVFGEFGWDEASTEELQNVEETMTELSIILDRAKRSDSFSEKIAAIDTVMHNYHAGIAPLEVVGASRQELFMLAEFLKKAEVDQLGFVVKEFIEPDAMPATLSSGGVFRRPVRVRAHRRRR